MPCKTHANVESVARCSGCQESFCSNCLVEIKGQRFCGSCKVMAIEGQASPVLENSASTTECELAKEAFKYAIIGIFCFGIILGPMAISKGIAARKLIEFDPSLTGSGKATAAIIIGFVVMFLWAFGVISKFIP